MRYTVTLVVRIFPGLLSCCRLVGNQAAASGLGPHLHESRGETLLLTQSGGGFASEDLV